MPSSYETLRRKFMTETDDGIARAERILRESGYVYVSHGTFRAPAEYNLEKHTRGDIIDASEYLVFEWDYSIR